MVDTAGIEPATPAMSTQCSPTELRAHHHLQITKRGNRFRVSRVGSRYILHFCDCARVVVVQINLKQLYLIYLSRSRM